MADKQDKHGKQDKLGEALMKVALGFQVAEVTEEFAEVDGEMKLLKRKRIKKDVPPDLKAVQLLLAENSVGEYAGFSDEQLEAEKQRLLQLLSGQEMGQVCVESKTAGTRKPRAKPRKRVVRKK